MTETTKKSIAEARLTIYGSEIQLLPLDALRRKRKEQWVRARSTLQLLQRYWDARKNLLETEIRHVKELIPEHYHEDRAVMVVCFAEGVVARYEQAEGSGTVVGVSDLPLAKGLRAISENVIWLLDEDEAEASEPFGPTFNLHIVGPDGSKMPISEFRCGLYGRMPKDAVYNGELPRRWLEMHNTFYLDLVGELRPINKGETGVQPFVQHTPVRLPVAWEAIEVFESITDKDISDSTIRMWAERDVLTEVTRRNTMVQYYLELDPYFEARNSCERILAEFSRVLATAKREEDLQVFLGANPALLDPTHAAVRAKVPLGRHVTDFVVRRATGEYLLVELENPAKRLLTKSNVQSAALTQAIDQIMDWRRYIESNLRTVENELDLPGISSRSPALVVIGRRASLTDEQLAKLRIIEGSQSGIRICTYDDLLQDAKSAMEHIVGPIGSGIGSGATFYPQE